MNLSAKKCISYKKGSPPLTEQQEDELLKKINNWALMRSGIHIITKLYQLKSFVDAIGFVVEVSLVAESEGHHPVIHIFYNKVQIELHTHALGGLSENDFIIAAKIDLLRKP
jgi:4a-hydroxytetrahydrobiopterin dehydratase